MEPLPPGFEPPDEPLPPGCERPATCALPPPPPGPPPSNAYYAPGYYPVPATSYEQQRYYNSQQSNFAPQYGYAQQQQPFYPERREHKRVRPEDVPAGPAGPIKKHRLDHPTTFVIAGGSSGAGFCFELKEALGRLGHATEVAKWKGHYEAHLNANVQLLEDCANDAAKVSEDASVLLVGNSFGCRVVAELLARRGDPALASRNAKKPLHPNVILDGAVFVSYPLYGPSAPRDAKGDRAHVLNKIRATAKCLFVSGEKDEFLDRTSGGTAWRKEHMPRGVAALRAVAADLPCAEGITVVGVENTGHNALKAGRKKVEPAKELMLRALEPFIEAFHGVELPIDTALPPGDDEPDDGGGLNVAGALKSHVRNADLPMRNKKVAGADQRI